MHAMEALTWPGLGKDDPTAGRALGLGPLSLTHWPTLGGHSARVWLMGTPKRHHTGTDSQPLSPHLQGTGWGRVQGGGTNLKR